MFSMIGAHSLIGKTLAPGPEPDTLAQKERNIHRQKNGGLERT